MHVPSLEKPSLIWLSAAVAFTNALPAISPSQFAKADRIPRDVCVIGGGAAGTYGAIRLKQLNKSVVVIEKEDHLGGHTHTYSDPATGRTADYGVHILNDIPVVRDYFAHLGIPLVTATSSSQPQLFVDFSTGQEVTVESETDHVATAFEKYEAQLAKYEYLTDGFTLPEPVPNDLLLRFGDFVVKYGLEAAVGPIARSSFGFGNILHRSTLYVLKHYRRGKGSLSSDPLAAEDGNMGSLYEAAQTKLGTDAMLQSTVIQMKRDTKQNVIHIIVQTPTGKKLITAGKLLVAIPPKLDNFKGFDLTNHEQSLFKQFRNIYLFTTLLNNTGFPENLTVINASPEGRYNLPSFPGPHSAQSVEIPGLTRLLYESTDPISTEAVKSSIVNAFRTIRSVARILPAEPDFLAFEDHSPYLLTVEPREIVGNFYRDLNSLQGQRNTYYTGAAFQTHNSAMIWNFTEGIVQKMAE